MSKRAASSEVLFIGDEQKPTATGRKPIGCIILAVIGCLFVIFLLLPADSHTAARSRQTQPCASTTSS